jgi:hypothetical protein
VATSSASVHFFRVICNRPIKARNSDARTESIPSGTDSCLLPGHVKIQSHLFAPKLTALSEVKPQWPPLKENPAYATVQQQHCTISDVISSRSCCNSSDAKFSSFLITLCSFCPSLRYVSLTSGFCSHPRVANCFKQRFVHHPIYLAVAVAPIFINDARCAFSFRND